MSKASGLGPWTGGVTPANNYQGGGIAGTMRNPGPQWERTPRWMFWRPAWRRAKFYSNGTQDYEYQTTAKRARAVLEAQFAGGYNDAPTQEGVMGKSASVRSPLG